MKEQSLKIAIADPSVILRSGIAVALKRISGFHIQTFEIASIELLSNYIRLHKPDLLIINPIFWGNIDIQKIKDESSHKSLKCFALITSLLNDSILKHYDDNIQIYETIDSLKNKLEKLFNEPVNNTTDDTESLSIREKEILSCVVKGMTNKEIAQELFLSTHTVISHRRNIARKLEIHSTAGLTIYAIVNKLVELNDIKSTIN